MRTDRRTCILAEDMGEEAGEEREKLRERARSRAPRSREERKRIIGIRKITMTPTLHANILIDYLLSYLYS